MRLESALITTYHSKPIRSVLAEGAVLWAKVLGCGFDVALAYYFIALCIL